jgi:hypothetical protein
VKARCESTGPSACGAENGAATPLPRFAADRGADVVPHNPKVAASTAPCDVWYRLVPSDSVPDRRLGRRRLRRCRGEPRADNPMVAGLAFAFDGREGRGTFTPPGGRMRSGSARRGPSRECVPASPPVIIVTRPASDVRSSCAGSPVAAGFPPTGIASTSPMNARNMESVTWTPTQ